MDSSPPADPACMPEAASSPLWSRLLRGLGAGAVAAILMLSLVPKLWSEWRSLRREEARTRMTRVIGYPGINAVPSYAVRPPNWFHEHGDVDRLWAGWTDGVGHRWFEVGKGDLKPGDLSVALGRDVIRAIDRPIVESGSGRRWDLIPPEAGVASHRWREVELAYPLLVLRTVEVVNDLVADQPLLVVYTPGEPDDRAVRLFDPRVEGRRITLGLSGYFRNGRPLLYDRQTESLWQVDGDRGLLAVAGRRKGTVLPHVAPAACMTWGEWVGRHPSGRLVVGADRRGGLPKD